MTKTTATKPSKAIIDAAAKTNLQRKLVDKIGMWFLDNPACQFCMVSYEELVTARYIDLTPRELRKVLKWLESGGDTPDKSESFVMDLRNLEQALVNNEYAVSRINDALVITRWRFSLATTQFDVSL